MSDATALQEFGKVLDQWEDLGNELSQWWVLENLAVLLARIGDGRARRCAGAQPARRRLDRRQRARTLRHEQPRRG